ncbi:heme ABC transporter permease [Curvivirga sp.]|uniref:heme ABC transporter permease n=1 Tax=Curvivirga sp. TaxID=2856848 RepID=UPI003B5BD9FA
MHKFANPTKFMKVANALFPVFCIGFIGLLTAGLYYSLLNSPEDYQQGHTVRIMYVHVPAAYMAVMIYGVMASCAASSLIWKHPLADLIARSSAPIGAAFTFLCLASGAFWGKPMWGTWWVWDARLTSVLIMFFLYMGYIALLNAFDDPQRGVKPAAILALVGVVNLPIIKFSVDWWNTLHQPASIIRLDGPTIDSGMLTPLFIMMGAFTLFYLMLLVIRLRAEFAAARIRTIRILGEG